MSFTLVLTFQSPGPGRWTDSTSISATTVAEAIRLAITTAALTLSEHGGQAALYDVVGRLVWQSETVGGSLGAGAGDASTP